MSTMQSPFGDYRLSRWPPGSDRSLRAWDAADELLLHHLSESYPLSTERQVRTVLCNDAHGALSCALHRLNPMIWSDSYLSHTATRRNWQANGLPSSPDCIESVSLPSGPFDLVLVKVPKTHALLEDQLARLRPYLHAQSVIIGAGMVRHLQSSVFKLFERYVGPVTTSLAVKKARLLFSRPDVSLTPPETPYPDSYVDKELQLSLMNHANVFCRDRVDIGARFFLRQFHHLPAANSIIDLACGNGILGICVQRLQPGSSLTFIDESYMAIESARKNYASLISHPQSQPQFKVGHGLVDVTGNSVDLILCNPPFHVQHAVAGDTARAFFKHSARCLNANGQIWVVANRHLPYRLYLRRLFKRCDEVAANARFVVLRASGQKQA